MGEMLEPIQRSLQVSWRPEGPDGAVARFVFRVLGAGEVGVAGEMHVSVGSRQVCSHDFDPETVTAAEGRILMIEGEQ